MTRMNKITQLFGIQYPIIQGGMIWNSGYKLASAVSNHGGLGLIGAGSMYPDILREHIQKCKKATNQPFGVNIPMLYPNLEEIIQIIIEEGVKIVFTSAGNPKTYTSYLKSHGITVVHVVSSSKFALKAQEAGVDAVVAEGFEAGGHNGREETTTLTLLPMVKEHLQIPLIAAIHGPCLGGGLELAMACHGRVASSDNKTVLGLPEVQLGLLPGSGGTQRLLRLVGLQKALDMMLTGKQLRAAQAKKAGLVDVVVPSSILLEAAAKMALSGKPDRSKPVKLPFVSQLLEYTSIGRGILFSQATKQTLAKTHGNYPAPLRIIDAVKAGVNSGIEYGLQVEARHFGELCMTPVSANLRNLIFATTQMKKESGAGDVKPRKVKKAAVLGGGLMGGGIANVTAGKAGVPVRIKDISQQGIANALK